MQLAETLTVLSHFQVKALFEGRQRGEVAMILSLDLGLTKSQVAIRADHVRLPDGQTLTWQQLRDIAQSEAVCFHVTQNEVRKIRAFSEELNRYYSLMPTEGAPTMLISGFPMHRIKGTEPFRDTLSKVKAIAPIHGRVLDTTMGLGYTAIEAAKTADHVTTIELDPVVVEICRLNPWSADLFHNRKIVRIIGDAFDEIKRFTDQEFVCIIHDPPTFSLAGELYSADFYGQLFRVLKPKGRVFHYIGDPASQTGRGVTRGVKRRLREAGFQRVVPHPDAFGVVATKET